MKIPAAKIEQFVRRDPEGEGVLGSAWLDVEGERLLATDGHRAIRVNVGVEPEECSGLVPIEVFELARKELKLIQKRIGKESIPDPWLKVMCSEEAICVENLLSATSHLVKRPQLTSEQKFPNVDAVFPGTIEKPTVTFQKSLLSEVVASIDGGISVSIWVSGSDKSVVLATDDGEATAILMPCMATPDCDGVASRGKAKK